MTVIVGAAVLAVAAGGAALTANALAATAPYQPGQYQQARAASVPADGVSTVSLQVEGGTTRLSVRAADLGGPHGTLLRTTSQDNSTSPDGTGQPRIQVRPAGPGKPEAVLLTLSGTVTITLNSAVTWWLEFAGGTQRTVLDLRAGHVAALAFTAGSQVIDAALPRPRGTVPVIMTGGASQFLLRLPVRVPVRVTAGGGAGSVTVDGSARTGVGGGSVVKSPGWDLAQGRFDVDATAGAASIAITRTR